MPHHTGPHGEAPEESMAKTFFGGVLQEGMGKAGYAGLGLASLNNFSRLWGTGVPPSYPVPGPGVIKAGG